MAWQHGGIAFLVAAMQFIEVRPCGIPAIAPLKAPLNKAPGRIANGWEARPHSLPWMVYIAVNENQTRYTCSGFLIDSGLVNQSDVVVTAAHCVYNDPVYVAAKSFYIFLGMHDMHGKEPSIIFRGVRNYMTHFYSGQMYDNDIALLRLTYPVRYTKEIAPLCLSTRHTVNTELNTCFAAGWGATEVKSPSNILMQTRMRVIPMSECLLKDRDAKLWCVREYYNRSSPCRGDSGSPLFCEIDGRYFAVGVLSLGPANCSTQDKRVGYYVRVDNYHEWATEAVRMLRTAPDQSRQSAVMAKFLINSRLTVPGLLSLAPKRDKTKSLNGVDLMATLSGYYRHSVH